SEHQALIPRTRGYYTTVTRFNRIIHTLCDVLRLLINPGQYRHGLVIIAVLCTGVADTFNSFPYYFGDVDVSLSTDFPHYHRHTRVHNRLTGNPGIGIPF